MIRAKKKHHRAYAIDQRNRDKAADKGQHGDKHIALFIKLIGQNAKPHAKDDADGEGDGERIANFIHLKLVLAGEENGHKGQRCTTADSQQQRGCQQRDGGAPDGRYHVVCLMKCFLCGTAQKYHALRTLYSATRCHHVLWYPAKNNDLSGGRFLGTLILFTKIHITTEAGYDT